MMRSWVVYWFLAVVIYVLGKVIKDKKIGSVPAIYVTNLIAIIGLGEDHPLLSEEEADDKIDEQKEKMKEED